MSFAFYCPTCRPDKFTDWTDEEKLFWCFSSGQFLSCLHASIGRDELDRLLDMNATPLDDDDDEDDDDGFYPPLPFSMTNEP